MSCFNLDLTANKFNIIVFSCRHEKTRMMCSSRVCRNTRKEVRKELQPFEELENSRKLEEVKHISEMVVTITHIYTAVFYLTHEY